MNTVNEVVASLTTQRQPLLDRLNKITAEYRTERVAIMGQLKPMNKAINILTPKTPKAPKEAKAPTAPKKGAKNGAK